MSDISDALVALDALIKAKLEGASDLSEFYDTRLGDLGISAATSVEKLMDIRTKMVSAVNAADPTEEMTAYL
jgi:hypothetical protein